MEKTPVSMRKQIAVIGTTNAGKSTLFNKLTGQDNSIISELPGTTTDPVIKTMELIPYGPISIIDTAGINDMGILGDKRINSTNKIKRRIDAAIYVCDINRKEELDSYNIFRDEKIPHILVFNKCTSDNLKFSKDIITNYPDAIFFKNGSDINKIHAKLSDLLTSQKQSTDSFLSGLLPPGSHVILVTPIDSEAPKGRLILPQVQVLRDCLDNGISSSVCREHELVSTLSNLRKVDLVITDSQAFSYVNEVISREIPLTSFSILLASVKGDFRRYVESVSVIPDLTDRSNILILEGCTHNSTHEDIGKHKIPDMLKKHTGKDFSFTHYSGYDFPDDLSSYSLAIQCGSCMLNRREIISRERLLQVAGVPITNYGVILAWGSGILERAIEIFNNENQKSGY